MSKRFRNAFNIWNGGACSLRAIARALTQAIDEAVVEGGGFDSANDPAVQMITDHLCFIVGLPQPSLDMSPEQWDEIYNAVKEKAQ